MMKLKHERTYYQTSFFKWRQRIGFGISDFACNLAFLLTNTYLLFYYTNCAGLDAKKVGFMFVVTKFIDAITDYLVGAWVDRTDTKNGALSSVDALRRADVGDRNGVIIFRTDRMGQYAENGMGICDIHYFLFGLYLGKYPYGAYCKFSFR